MPDTDDDPSDLSIEEADLRNGEPDALVDDDATNAVPEDLDVTEPTGDGEPIHHAEGGDGAD